MGRQASVAASIRSRRHERLARIKALLGKPMSDHFNMDCVISFDQRATFVNDTNHATTGIEERPSRTALQQFLCYFNVAHRASDKEGSNEARSDIDPVSFSESRITHGSDSFAYAEALSFLQLVIFGFGNGAVIEQCQVTMLVLPKDSNRETI